MDHSLIIFLIKTLICLLLIFIVKKKGYDKNFFKIATNTFLALLIYMAINFILLLIEGLPTSDAVSFFQIVDYLIITLAVTIFIGIKKRK